MVNPQLLASLLARGAADQSAPGPMLSQPAGRDPVSAMQSMMGNGASGIGGGSAGMLGGLDPMKLAQLKAMLNGPQYTGTGGAGMAAPGSANFAGTGGIY